METCISIYVTFEGLGFCSFDPKRGGADIALLRLPDHVLKIKIAGDNGRSYKNETVKENSEIKLMSENTIIEGFRLNINGKFDRSNGLDPTNDLFDLRWLVDMEGKELHEKKAKPREKPQVRGTKSVTGLTRMFLPNAYFYNEQVLPTNYRIDHIIEETRIGKPKPFGLIGGSLGAKVDAVKASLLIDGKNEFQFDKGINREEITRFVVTISNLCRQEHEQEQSDFYKYYEVMDFQDNKKFDFRLPAEGIKEPKSIDFFRGRRPIMCEFVWLSQTENLNAFFPSS